MLAEEDAQLLRCERGRRAEVLVLPDDEGEGRVEEGSWGGHGSSMWVEGGGGRRESRAARFFGRGEGARGIDAWDGRRRRRWGSWVVPG